eukprot:12276058-Alexandrium_andersonii.AAC.1
MQLMVTKAKGGADDVKWVFMTVADLAKAGHLSKGELAVRALGQGGAKGIVEKLSLKRRIKDHVLGE